MGGGRSDGPRLVADEDQRMTAVAARVAARPVQGVPRSRPGVALTWEFTGAPPGTRTPNPRIKSPLLCQLS